jgi:hypothetical protein
MKNYFLTFALAVSVVTGGVSLRQGVAGIGSSPVPPRAHSVLGIGSSPVPPRAESMLGIGSSPVPPRAESVLGIGSSPVPPRAQSQTVESNTTR